MPEQTDQGVIGQFDADQMNEDQRKILEATVLKSYELIYNDSGIKELVGSDDVNKVENVANASFMIAKKLTRAEEQSGRPPIPDSVLAVAGYHTVDKLIELAEHQGVSFSPDEEKAALQASYQKYISDGIKNRTIDPAALAKAVEQTPEGKGQIGQALATVPDVPDTTGAQAAPGASPEATPAPAAAPSAVPEVPQSLLSQPSPLERFLR